MQLFINLVKKISKVSSPNFKFEQFCRDTVRDLRHRFEAGVFSSLEASTGLIRVRMSRCDMKI